LTPTLTPTPERATDPLHVLIRDVSLRFGERRVFEDLRCGFPWGEISVVLGSSGGGKSTLLRLLGGLLRPDRGEIFVAGESITQGDRGTLERARRRIGMMFQHGALLDSMTVFDNLALPLREHSELDEAQIAERVRSQLDAVGLDDVERLLPGQLSGGMVKRTALARAMIEEPEILLCDEPLSGLDPVSVRRIETLLVDVNRRSGISMIITSHHIPSTLRMADHIVFLLHGRALEAPPDLIRQSASAEVREFVAAEDPESLDALRRPKQPDPAAPAGAQASAITKAPE
jgi:phospholipid/cholesterol/gamma-HCH transport system ATP-binding protein